MKQQYLALTGLLLATKANAIELYINHNLEHYSVELSREQGEVQINDLCFTTDSEESWIFVKYTDEREIWYEDGGEAGRGYVMPDKNVLETILAKQKEVAEISHYHIHPAKPSVMATPHHPSIDDSYYAIQIATNVLEASPDIVFDDRVVTPYGIYVQSFADEGLATHETRTKIRNIVSEPVIKAVETGNFPFDFKSDDVSVIRSEAHRYAAVISGENVTVTFIEMN
ncbi:hypothetical protein COV16_01825 [Candidatus Woesearchaeota archaeon CG10_big_fil_rev_8_21_14_0_10_34_8]|nr:MAG: hypothetical protein COV16_01825 [Candidatus Woesearchaeota archaeon CG10_big_fil_rev_8_21_14_0_10_34_8]